MGSTFGGAGGSPDDGDMSGGKLFAAKAIKGVLAGAGNGMQQEAGGSPPPVDFAKLMTPPVRKKPVVPAMPMSGPQSASLYGD